MKPLVGLAGVLLAASAAAGQPGPIAITAQEEVAARNDGAAGLICEIRKRHRPPPELEVTITPSEVKIPDNAKRGTRLATVTVRWSDGKPFRGELQLTRNTAFICQLSGRELLLSRDVTKADDYKRSDCTVTAIK
jgi:uncharacterized lipoprotein YbaY